MPVSFFMVRRRVPSRMACTCKLKSSKAEAPATISRIGRTERARCRQANSEMQLTVVVGELYYSG